MPRPGERIGPWVVEDALGEGAMGSVYRCHHHTATRMRRAVKILGTEAAVPDARARFTREAETMFSLSHPAIVSVVDVSLDNDPPYLVMELVEGESLESRMRRGIALSVDEAARVFRVVADGLRHVHGRGVRHRDIKPANIMLGTDSVPRLVDFGIALDEQRTRLTQTGMSFGTMSYMPPELFVQANGDEEQRDVYALGVVMYEAMLLKRAFPEPAGVPLHEAWRKVHGDKTKRGALDPGPGYPNALRSLIRDATHPDPAKRFKTMGAMIDAIDEIEAGAAADEERAVMLTQTDITDRRRLDELMAARSASTSTPAAPPTPRPKASTGPSPVLMIAVLLSAVLIVVVFAGLGLGVGWLLR